MPTEETQIAVLQTEFKNISQKMDDFKEGQRVMQNSIDDMKRNLDDAYVKRIEHSLLVKKVDVLWDWRWKVMGLAMAAGVVADILLRLFDKLIGTP